jgi:acyl-coenzyme A synthetase/AMP-(fatty) acid ligase/acyl carrier protein
VREIRGLYEDVLGAADVGAGDSFFTLGGDSLLVLLLLERVEQETGVHVPLEDFYDAPTLAGLTAALARRAWPARAPAAPVEDLAEALRAAAGPDLRRPAVVAPDGCASFEDVVGRVAAAGAARSGAEARPPRPHVLRLTTSVAGALEVLEGLAAHRPFLVLDPAATAWEEQRAVDLFAAELERRAADAAATGQDVFAVTTSGSTGQPKVVVVPHGVTAAHQRVHATLYSTGPGDAHLVLSPLHHFFGLSSGLLLGLLSGASVVLPAHPLTPSSLAGLLRQHPAAMAVGWAHAYRILLAGDAPLEGLRLALTAGEPLPQGALERWAARTGAPFVDCYGTSETDKISSNTDLVPGSVGRPIPGVDVRVRGEGGLLAQTGLGELLVRSPALALGYAGAPEQTAERFRDGWYETRDLVEVRADGHLVLRGRIDEQISLGGVKVDPWEVEAVCREVLDLQECLVTAAPGPEGVRQLCLYVVAPRPVGRGDVVRALRGRLSPHKVPARVVQVQALPRSSSGKLLRRELGA